MAIRLHTQAEFKCISYGYEDNADVIEAMNIPAAGQAVTACVCGKKPSDEVRSPLR
jgi:hypothetical protein